MCRDRVKGTGACVLSVKNFHKMKSRVSKEEVCLSLLKGSTWTYCFGKKKESLCETWPFKYLPAEMLSDFTVLLVNCKENYRTNARVLTTLQVNILYLMVLPGFTWCLPSNFSMPFDSGRLAQLFKAAHRNLHVTESSQPFAICHAGDLGSHESLEYKGMLAF